MWPHQRLDGPRWRRTLRSSQQAEAGAAGRFVAAVSATLAAQSRHRINAYNFVAFGRDGCSIEQYLGMRNINEVVLTLHEEMVMFRDVRIKIRLRSVPHERVALAQRLTRSEPAANIQSPGKVTGRNAIMMEHPVIRKALSAALVGSLLLPLGSLLLPYLDIPVLPFDVMEAVVSATRGFGIAEWLS